MRFAKFSSSKWIKRRGNSRENLAARDCVHVTWTRNRRRLFRLSFRVVGGLRDAVDVVDRTEAAVGTRSGRHRVSVMTRNRFPVHLSLLASRCYALRTHQRYRWAFAKRSDRVVALARGSILTTWGNMRDLSVAVKREKKAQGLTNYLLFTLLP